MTIQNQSICLVSSAIQNYSRYAKTPKPADAVKSKPIKCFASRGSEVLHQRGCKQLCSEPRILSPIDLAVPSVAAHVSLHIGDVVELGDVAVFLHVGSFVFRHGGDEVFDDFVGDK